jgi:hypothetical protein
VARSPELLTAADLSLPEDLDDPRDAAPEVAPVGAEGQAQELGGAFLAGRWIQIRSVQGAVMFDLSRRRL